jgi:Type II secretion system (T2SS), protein G
MHYLRIASVVFVICLIIAALSTCLVERIPPRSMTTGAMTETRFRMEMYLQEEKDLPKSLEVLPLRENHMNLTTDAWRRPLIYTVEEGGFELKSLGKDGVPGGNGDDEDIVMHYRVVNDKVEEALP